MKKIHFITGLAPDFGGKPFGFAHYMAIRSALAVNPDCSVSVYFEHEPQGPYWNLIKPDINPVPVVAPTQVFGRPLTHFAHKADVLRLEILLREGGVYLDLDTICQKPFGSLLDEQMVMGIESGSKGIEQWHHPGGQGIVGLCNATMIAAPGSEFLQAWYKCYETFDGSQWNEHSVRLPARLAKASPQLIRIEPPESFFWPNWSPAGIEALFVDDGGFPEAYSFHLWESLSWKHLSGMDVYSVLENDTAYNRIARRFVARDLAELKAIADRERAARFAPASAVFEKIYRDNVWGDGSGSGSSPANTGPYRDFLQAFLRDNRIRSVVDLGCGDWQFSRHIDWAGIRYHGLDIVEPLISKLKADHSNDHITFELFRDIDQVPAADLVICKDVLQHCSNERISHYVRALTRKARFLLVTNDVAVERGADRGVNEDIADGNWRPIRLDAPPFSLQAPIVFTWNIRDSYTEVRKAVSLLVGSRAA